MICKTTIKVQQKKQFLFLSISSIITNHLQCREVLPRRARDFVLQSDRKTEQRLRLIRQIWTFHPVVTSPVTEARRLQPVSPTDNCLRSQTYLRTADRQSAARINWVAISISKFLHDNNVSLSTEKQQTRTEKEYCTAGKSRSLLFHILNVQKLLLILSRTSCARRTKMFTPSPLYNCMLTYIPGVAFCFLSKTGSG